MRGRWARYRALDPGERRLFHEALRALLAARLRLAAGSFRSALAWSRRSRGARPAEVEPERLGPAVGRAVRRAAVVLPGSKCLPQALAGAVLLRRRGREPELRLGAATGADGRLSAHAWLELEGRVVLGEFEPGRFRAFDALPPEPAEKKESGS